MAQVTIEGSKTTPTTFLKAGARITVERTPYIDKLLRRGYVNLIRDHSSTETAIDEVSETVDKQREAAASEHALTGAPPLNASSEDWRTYMHGKGFSGLENATRAEMIAAWKQDQETRGESVD